MKHVEKEREREREREREKERERERKRERGSEREEGAAERKIECRLSVVVANGPECLFRYRGKRRVTR